MTRHEADKIMLRRAWTYIKGELQPFMGRKFTVAHFSCDVRCRTFYHELIRKAI